MYMLCTKAKYSNIYSKGLHIASNSTLNRTSIRLAIFAQRSCVTDRLADTPRYGIIGRTGRMMRFVHSSGLKNSQRSSVWTEQAGHLHADDKLRVW